MSDLAATGYPGHSIVELDRATALDLLATVPIGRVVFSHNALPAIRPVNHLVDADGRIIVRTRLTAVLTSAVRGNSDVVVAYQADEIDPHRRTGWSVVVTGLARPVTDPVRIARYEPLLHPWVHQVMDTVIEIEPSIVSGIRLVDKAA
ncbi:pyridoxamine 5'-phosphate oxidase family protein [Nocardia sp. NPDC052112]|uniref:pyridoxamine 5'-phosphate oxidase family protein n=1 Tax=Nocardia sp. NPDC052112 TaxID=3155646 RepID=UPI003428042A